MKSLYRQLLRPLVISYMRRSLHSDEENTISHKENCFELLYLTEGAIHLEINNKFYKVERGDFFLICPNVHYRYTLIEEKTCLDLMYIGFVSDKHSLNYKDGELQIVACSISQALNKEEKGQVHLANKYRNKTHYHFYEGAEYKKIYPIFKNLIDEHTLPSFAHDKMFRALSEVLWIQILRTIVSLSEPLKRYKKGNASNIAERLRQYYIDHYNEECQLQEFSEKIHLSMSYVSRVFREVVGMTPSSYLMQIRITKACQLLEEGDSKIRVIAKEVGFGSVQRFNSIFKKWMGVTPASYKKQRKEYETRNY